MKKRALIGYTLMVSSTLIVLVTLLSILGFIFIEGGSVLSLDYLTTSQSIEKVEVVVSDINPGDISYEINATDVKVIDYNKKLMVTKEGETFNIPSGAEIEINQINGTPISYFQSNEEIEGILSSSDTLTLKLTLELTGLLSMIITTIVTIVLSLLIALPLGVMTAIYLIEYQPTTKFNEFVHFAIDSLSAIPSIVYGLFGLFFFIQVIGLPISSLVGSLTMSIMLLPIIIKTTEEALLSVPDSFREGSYGLGANKIQTIYKIILPSAIPGIFVGVILSIGRIIGESAILIFTAGTVDKLTFNPLESSSTLTVKAYMLAKEYGDIQGAAAIGVIILFIIIILNISSKVILNKFSKKLG